MILTKKDIRKLVNASSVTPIRICGGDDDPKYDYGAVITPWKWLKSKLPSPPEFKSIPYSETPLEYSNAYGDPSHMVKMMTILCSKARDKDFTEIFFSLQGDFKAEDHLEAYLHASLCFSGGNSGSANFDRIDWIENENDPMVKLEDYLERVDRMPVLLDISWIYMDLASGKTKEEAEERGVRMIEQRLVGGGDTCDPLNWKNKP